jgi:hypothetical protein
MVLGVVDPRKAPLRGAPPWPSLSLGSSFFLTAVHGHDGGVECAS